MFQIYIIDHVAIDRFGNPYHARMRVFADNDIAAFFEGRKVDPRLSWGAEVYPERNHNLPI
jgi:hypothetical protein